MSRPSTIRLAAIGIAFSGLLALTACGGDDKGSSDTKASDTTEATADTTAAATDETASDETIATDETTATDDSVVADTSDIDALSTDECNALRDKYASLLGDAEDPDYSKLEQLYGDLADEVPGELKGDVETLQTAFQPFFDLLKKYDYDITKAAADPAFAEIGTSVDSPDVQAATQRLDAYFANCDDSE
jgi:hypothetical protein